MFRTIYFYLYFTFYILFSLPKLITVNNLLKEGKIEQRDTFIHAEVLKWGQAMLRASGSTVNVIGTENIPKDGAVVFISNHQGNFDIPILLSFLDKPKGFVAKLESLKMPIFPKFMRHLNCVFMDRKDIRQSARTISEAIDNLKKGYSMVIFPEGKRSKSSQMREFKSGSFKMATKAEVPIVPVTMNGSYKIMENNGFLIKPSTVTVIVSKPVTTAGLTKEEIGKIPQKVEETIRSNLATL